MIETVDMAGTTYAEPPHRFEAGTPMIAQAVGLGAAIDYLTAIGMDSVRAHEQALTAHALEAMATVPGLTVIGPTCAATLAMGGKEEPLWTLMIWTSVPTATYA